MNRTLVVWDIQLLQGPSERGKDIVFKYMGPFGEIVHCACVIKNVGLTGKVTSSNAAHVVVQQARQALLNPYIDNRGEPITVHRVFVITPKRLQPQAIEAVAGELRERAGQIHFIHGDELVRLFQRHWPDFLADEAEALSRYTDAVSISLSQESEIAKVSRLYPDADIGEIRALHYVATDFIVQVKRYNVSQFLTLLPPDDFFYAERSIGEVEDVRLFISSFANFIRHLEIWGYDSLNLGEQFDLVVSRFLNSFREWWLAVEAIRLLAVEGRVITVKESERLTKSRAEVVNSLKALRLSSGHIIEGIQRDLSIAHRLLRDLDLRDPGLLRYLRAADCLYTYGADADSAIGGEVLQELRLTLQKIRTHQGLLLVVGPAGYGKTSLCRWSGLEDLRLWRSGQESKIPLYIRLGYLPRSPRDEEDLLQVSLHAALLGDVDWGAIHGGEVPVRIYLDGLDEIAAAEDRRRVVDLARKLAAKYVNWQVILTSRDYIRATWLSNLPRVSLAGFQEEEVGLLASALLQDRPHGAEAFLEQINGQRQLADLCHVPLLATLMILIFGNTGDLPSRRASLYSTFVDLLCGGWDLAKGIQRNVYFGREVKIAILTRLASMVHGQRRRVVEVGVFNDVCLATVPGVFAGHAADKRGSLVERLLQELLSDGLLTRAGIHLQFSHFSFQEFMVARGLAHGGLSLDTETIIDAYLYGDDWWRDVIFFFVGLSADPERFVDWIENRPFEGSSPDLHVKESRRLALINEVKNAFPALVSDRR